MPKIADWNRHIGRTLRLRDLHVFFTVVHWGSMAKAGAHLGVTQSAVSQVIGDLEHAVGVKLLDRSPQGVEPTSYGRALLKGGNAAFDELKQTIQEIEFLADPTVGEVRIGCPETVAALLPPVVQSLSRRYPGIVVHVSDVVAPTLDLPQIRDRTLDLALVRVAGSPSRHRFGDDLKVEVVFDDETLVVAGQGSRWAGRRKIDIAELADEPWILPPPQTLNSMVVADAFKARGLEPPKIKLVTFSVQLRINLLEDGPYLSVMPRSMMRLYGKRLSVAVLPVRLPTREWPVAMVMLKRRSLNPAVKVFIEHLRESAKAFAAQ